MGAGLAYYATTASGFLPGVAAATIAAPTAGLGAMIAVSFNRGSDANAPGPMSLAGGIAALSALWWGPKLAAANVIHPAVATIVGGLTGLALSAGLIAVHNGEA